MSASVTATFVFTDLVDSTATAARLGPEGADELRQTLFGLLRSAISASGGTEVKNLGDSTSPFSVLSSTPTKTPSWTCWKPESARQCSWSRRRNRAGSGSRMR